MLNLSSVGFQHPEISFNEWKEHFFVNFFRTTSEVVPLNFKEMSPTLKYLPAVKAGLKRIFRNEIFGYGMV